MCQIFSFSCDCKAGKIVIIIHKTNWQCLDFILKALEQSLDNNIHYTSVLKHGGSVEGGKTHQITRSFQVLQKELESMRSWKDVENILEFVIMDAVGYGFLMKR